MIYVNIDEKLYPATIRGRVSDKEWDGRESKEITIKADFATVNELFFDGVIWSIVEDVENESSKVQYDNSEFCIRGDLTIHIDGSCTVKMGKPTDLENAYEVIYGGI